MRRATLEAARRETVCLRLNSTRVGAGRFGPEARQQAIDTLVANDRGEFLALGRRHAVAARRPPGPRRPRKDGRVAVRDGVHAAHLARPIDGRAVLSGYAHGVLGGH